MGREIRKVPPNWEHPKQQGWSDGRLQPMYNGTFATASREWKEEYAKWERGERPDYCSDESKKLEYWEWNGGPPDREYYCPWDAGEATWVQVWETVSEGTPVTPPFATPKELVDYLATHGDFWDQKRGDGPWDREHAEAFVSRGWAPSFMINKTPESTEIFAPRDGMPA